MTTWGIVATIKANAKDVISFVAHHLELGADEIQIYLDAPCDRAVSVLAEHKNVHVILCDEAYWRKRRPNAENPRPFKHQVRQTINASRAYRTTSVDWLFHIDVDEFLWAEERPIHECLADLPTDARCARIRPLEALSTEGQKDLPSAVTPFKSIARPLPQRKQETRNIYPVFGEYLNGGFLSHAMGKVVVRTGQKNIEIRIHNMFADGEKNPGEFELPEVTLCHMHAHSWAQWRKSLDFRLRKGSYRAELAPAVSYADDAGLTMNELFAMIRDEQGEDGLRNFFTEVCLATPELRRRLDAHGRLHMRQLDLPAKRERHFGKEWA